MKNAVVYIQFNKKVKISFKSKIPIADQPTVSRSVNL